MSGVVSEADGREANAEDNACAKKQANDARLNAL